MNWNEMKWKDLHIVNRMRANKKFCFAEGTPKPAPADQAEKGEGAEAAETEKLNTKNNGV